VKALGFGGGVKFFARVLAHCFQQVVARVLAWRRSAMTMDLLTSEDSRSRISLGRLSGRPPMDEYLPSLILFQSDNQSRAASAASSVQPPAKTDRRCNSSRSASLSSS